MKREIAEANSRQAIARITTRRVAVNGELKDGHGVYKLKREYNIHTQRNGKQINCDIRQVFSCEVQAGESDQAELEEAEEVEQQCKENEAHQEESWDGGNDCRRNPEMVREARCAETE